VVREAPPALAAPEVEVAVPAAGEDAAEHG